MFAPYCPTCSSRVLLGPRRIVSADMSAKPFRVTLRCFCGTTLATGNPVPEPRPDVGSEAVVETRVA
jgi:hypothetical protein